MTEKHKMVHEITIVHHDMELVKNLANAIKKFSGIDIIYEQEWSFQLERASILDGTYYNNYRLKVVVWW